VTAIMNKLTAWNLIKETFKSWDEDRAPRLAAALAYYTIFALAPLLIIAIAVAALFFDEAQVRQNMLNEIGALVGQNGRQAIEAMMDGASKPTTGLIATVIGVVTLLIAAGGFFNQLQDALNTIWEVQPKPGRGVWGIIKDRALSFTMVLATGFLLLASLIISTILSAAGKLLGGHIGDQALFWQLINLVASFGISTLLFAVIFKVLPDAKILWRDVWIGAAATALLFTLGRFLIGWYLGHTATESAYGAAGSLVALLIWVYYSTQILFLGAEFTQVYAKSHGAHIEPTANAVPVTPIERAQQGLTTQAVDETLARERRSGSAPFYRKTVPYSDKSPLTLTAMGKVALAFMFGIVLGWQRKPPIA
jgi:membrane protein